MKTLEYLLKRLDEIVAIGKETFDERGEEPYMSEALNTRLAQAEIYRRLYILADTFFKHERIDEQDKKDIQKGIVDEIMELTIDAKKFVNAFPKKEHTE